jgi:hypothetical protein
MSYNTLLGEVEQLARRLGPEEQLHLMERLARSLRLAGRQSPPQNLYGAWKARFPVDFDVESELDQIRSAWKGDVGPGEGGK